MAEAGPGANESRHRKRPLRQQLGRYRIEVAAEPDAEQAFVAAAAIPPALVVVAVEEPDKAGFKVFQRCKKGALGKVPIVLVTASVAPESFAKHRSLKVHADDYIDKPFSPKELVARMKAVRSRYCPSFRLLAAP